MLTEVISITSGKGGVGKTNITANLASVLSKKGKKVLVVDGDFGLANVDTLLGIRPKFTIEDVIRGTARIEDVVVDTPAGFKLLPAGSGVVDLINMTEWDRIEVIDRLEEFAQGMDLVLIDTGAGIHRDVLFLNASSEKVVLIVTPEPTSFADTYALIKVLSTQHKVHKFSMISNMVKNDRQGAEIYRRLTAVSDRFLNVSIDYLGSVTEDLKVRKAILNQSLFTQFSPACSASESIVKIANNMAGAVRAPNVTGNLQIFWRELVKGNLPKNEEAFA